MRIPAVPNGTCFSFPISSTSKRLTFNFRCLPTVELKEVDDLHG